MNAPEWALTETGIPTQYPPSPINVPILAVPGEPAAGGGLGFGSGSPEIPCARMHTAQWSRRANACAVGGVEGTCLTGSKPLQSLRAAVNAGEEVLTPGMLLRSNPPPPAIGSGKFGTPRERMHREKLSPAGWAWLALAAETDVERCDEPEPHAATIALATIAAAADVAREPTRDMAHVIADRRLQLPNSTKARRSTHRAFGKHSRVRRLHHS